MPQALRALAALGGRSSKTLSDQQAPRPTAAAVGDAERAPCGASQIYATRQLVGVPVRTPLPHVAVHVVKPPLVWRTLRCPSTFQPCVPSRSARRKTQRHQKKKRKWLGSPCWPERIAAHPTAPFSSLASTASASLRSCLGSMGWSATRQPVPRGLDDSSPLPGCPS